MMPHRVKSPLPYAVGFQYLLNLGQLTSLTFTRDFGFAYFVVTSLFNFDLLNRVSVMYEGFWAKM